MHKIDRTGEHLTTFSPGDTYLMVEMNGVSCAGVKTKETCPTIFRFNVPDVEAACNELRSKGVILKVNHHTWGITAGFSDPDGNPCALRSDKGFGE